MKYIPLVWAALTRKPARAILTLLAMTVAFMLVGLTIGMRATVERTMEMARMDRLYVNPRFGGYMPVAMGRQIAGRAGVREVQPIGEVWGYYQDLKNNVDVEFGDMRRTRSEWPITPAQWDELAHNPTGIIMSRLQAQRWHKKVGDTFTMKAPAFTRIDGTTTWTFKVLAVSDEMLLWPDGYIFGNFLYWDKSRALADQGKAEFFEMLANDPTRATLSRAGSTPPMPAPARPPAASPKRAGC